MRKLLCFLVLGAIFAATLMGCRSSSSSGSYSGPGPSTGSGGYIPPASGSGTR